MKKLKKQKIKLEDKGMNAMHELFCRAYTGYTDPDCFNNKTKSFIYANHLEKEHAELLTKSQAYLKDAKEQLKRFENNCASQAVHLFRNVKIRDRINELFDSMFNDTRHVDRQLVYLITQKKDLATGVQAVREYNRMKDRIKKTESSDTVTFTWETDNSSTTEAPKVIKSVTVTRKQEDDDVEFDD